MQWPSTNNPGYKWSVVVMLWCISLFNYADRQAIFSVFPLLERDLHFTSVQLGLLASSFAWVYGLGAPFAGTLVDRVRRKAAILGGLFAWSVICMATALSQSFNQLFCFRAAEGLGETFYYPASMSMISDYHGQGTRSRAMGTHQTSVYVGTIGGGFFAGLIGQVYGWRWSFIVFGGLGIALTFVLRRILLEPERGAAEFGDVGPGQCVRTAERLSVGGFFRMVWGTPTVLILMLAFMCANFVALVLLSWMPKFLYDKFNLGLAMAGLSATVFVQVASMVGSPLGGWLADVTRKRTPGGRMMVQAIAVLCGAPCVVFVGQTRSMRWLILALFVWGLFKGLYDANIFASVYDVIRLEARGAAAGFMNMMGWVGGGAAPLLVGYVAERRSLSLAISLAAVVYVVAGLLLLTGIFAFVRRDVAQLQAQRDTKSGVAEMP